MTKTEIVNKSNTYKSKVNDCESKINKCSHSIDTFGKFKAYLENSLSKVKQHKKFTLTFLCCCSAFAAISVFISIPVAIVLLVGSIVSLERFVFFTKVTSKFEHCVEYLSNVVEKLTSKQSKYLSERDFALEEIIKLEKAIPEVITYLDEINALEENKTEDLVDNTLDVCGI